MIKGILIVLGYLTTLSSLSMTAIMRMKIGQNTFLPLGIKLPNPYSRALMRFFIVVLVFVYIRIFFIIELNACTDPSPFDLNKTPWELLTDFRLPLGWNAHIILFYLSYIASIAALAHILLLEIYHIKKIKVTRNSLGESFLFRRIEGSKVLGRTIDDFFVNSIIEPVFVFGLGYLIQMANGYKTLGTFFMISGVSMLLQGHLSRMKFRNDLQDIEDGEKTGSRIRKRRRTNDTRADENDDVVTIA